MRTLLFYLVILLCVNGTLQKKGVGRTRRRRTDAENSTVVVPVPRVFIGFFPPTMEASNGTLAPNSTHPPRDLQLQNNATAEYLKGRLSTRVIPTIYLLVVAVGIPANLAILCALASKIRKVSSAILYCSLAVSDLLLLLSLFFKAHYHFHGNDWALGEAACRVVTACFYGNLYCSAQTLACISIKRYLAVVHPFWYKTLPKRMCTAWVTLSVWVVFAVAIIPELLIQQTYKLQHLDLDLTTCHDVLPLQPDSRVFLLSYNLTLTILGLLLPLVVSVFCYIRIVCELNRSNLDWMMYIKASSLVFTIFLMCFTPAGILHLLHYVQLFSHTDKLYIHFNVAVCLCCLHACLDPFLFVLMSKSAGSRTYFRPFKSTTLSVSV